MAGKPAYEELGTRVEELEKEAAERKLVEWERTGELSMANDRVKRKMEERKRAEGALKESEEKYRSMMEAMHDPVYICSPDYRVTYMNPAMIERTGRNAIGEACYKLVHGRDAKCTWCVHDKVQQGELSQTELVSPKDNHFYRVCHSPIFHKDGSISKMTIFRDLTMLKRTQEALQDSEARYRILAEHLAEGVALVQEGKLLYASHAFSSILGYEGPKQLIGRRIADLTSDSSDPGIKEIYRSLDSGISCEETFQAACRKKDGGQFWVEVRHIGTKWNGRPALLSIISDSTKKTLKETAIQEKSGNLQREDPRPGSPAGQRDGLGKIVGRSPAIQEVYDLILSAADSDANVVIYGESGTGKELVAHAIHEMSSRSDGAFACVNCGAIPETLLESEFFGYKKGAFTGACADKHGYLDLADGGTLFLDEVGEIGLGMQVKLLRAIDGGGYTPVGSIQARKSDFRIIGATNRDLTDLVKEGLIREDFFYRIHIIPITVPPLRDRKDDIPLLIDHFLKLHGNGNKRSDIPWRMMECLHNYDWPGNVRELQNVLQRYLTVKRMHLLGPIAKEFDYLNGTSGKDLDQEDLNFHRAMEGFQKDVIVRALEQTHWHRGRAASMLGIDRKTLFRKMRSLELI
jgi:PAS domain S-box-containing protein